MTTPHSRLGAHTYLISFALQTGNGRDSLRLSDHSRFKQVTRSCFSESVQPPSQFGTFELGAFAACEVVSCRTGFYSMGITCHSTLRRLLFRLAILLHRHFVLQPFCFPVTPNIQTCMSLCGMKRFAYPQSEIIYDDEPRRELFFYLYYYIGIYNLQRLI